MVKSLHPRLDDHFGIDSGIDFGVQHECRGDNFDHDVVDGADSYAPGAQTFIFPHIIHMKDSIFRYTSQGLANACHDIHDNVFEYWYHPLDAGAHANMLECNDDGASLTAEVFYNNIFRHTTSSFASDVVIWRCPENTPEYWFNNLLYDVANTGNILGHCWAPELRLCWHGRPVHVQQYPCRRRDRRPTMLPKHSDARWAIFDGL